MRVKLTVYYLALLTAVLAFFGVAVYTYITRSLVTLIDTSLTATVQTMEHRLRLGDLSDEAQSRKQEDEMMIAPLIVQVINEAGELVDEQVMLKIYHLPVKLEELQEIKDNDLHFGSVRLASGEPLRTVTQRTRDEMGRIFYIRVGQSLSPLQKARRQLLILLAIAGPGALLLGSYGGLLLANQVLNPVARLTRTAEEIEASDLSKRVPLPPQKDELSRLAGTFNRMIARLQGAFERQRQFTADASHEMRTPLAVMRGDIEIALRRERTPEEYRSVLTSNLEEIIRLSRLVEDLLMLARADADQSALRYAPVNIGELCTQVTEYLHPLASEKGLQWTYECPTNAPLTIKGDAQRLKQMLLNLLDNAIKYTPQNGEIKLSLVEESNDAVLRVADTGRGIPAEDLPYIFERFFRHSRSTSDKGAQGFGLGLSIVKWIVTSHGGTISAASEASKGTTFTVRLPLL